MKLLRAATVTTGNLTTNAIETAPAWTTATWALGAVVQRNQRRWESLRAANTNHPPETSPEWWLDIGPVNGWAMFDDKTGTQTTRAEDITASIMAAGRVDAVALMNVDAADVSITIEDGATTVYSETFSMVSDDGITDLWSWLFEPIERRNDLYVDGLPNISGPTVTVQAAAPGGVAAIGHCVPGSARTLGITEEGASVGISDYSRPVVDEFGEWSFVERGYAKRGEFTVWIERANTDYVFKLLASYRAKPVVVVGSDEFGATMMFGIPKDWRIGLNTKTHSVATISFQGI